MDFPYVKLKAEDLKNTYSKYFAVSNKIIYEGFKKQTCF